MDIFNLKEWSEKIKQPTWYFDIPQLMKGMQELWKQDQGEYTKTKEQVYSFFEEALGSGEIALGDRGKNFDEERLPIDTVVIHHTHNKPGITPERLSAMTLLRLYATYYANPTYENDLEIKGKPIYSGHVRDGSQVFYPYHWIVRADGSVEQLLNDNEIGWHAGNWNTNRRSVAIVLDNNYEDAEPSEQELEAITDIVRKHYPQISRDQILGHREVNTKTTCPSNFFLGEGGWKEKLLAKLGS